MPPPPCFRHRIPYFRDVIVYAFECPHCYHRTSDVQSANEIAVHGCRITLNASNKQVCVRLCMRSCARVCVCDSCAALFDRHRNHVYCRIVYQSVK
jgi:C4-type Zn-finger protein